ncbi:unnamed protein product [Agarophyton chilense]
MSDSAAGQVSVGTAKMIGFLLAICGNTLIACSLTLQKKAHNAVEPDSDSDLRPEAEQEPETPESEQLARHDADVEQQGLESSSRLSDAGSTSELHILRNPTWWLGTFLMAAGEVGNFAAFAFAPASLVAPLGAWSVVLSAILAHIFLQEHVSNANLLGIALCVTGAFLIGAAGPDVSAAEASLDAGAVTRLLLRTPFVVFILLTLTATAVLIYISHHTTLGQRHIYVYVGVSSLLGGVTVVCAKALSTFLRLTIEGNSQFGNFLPFLLVIILALAILAQLRYLNMAMAQFGNAQVIPVYYVLFTTCAMTSGVIMYREFDALTSRNIPFFLGICSTMSGVFLVSRSVKASNAKLNADSAKDGSGRQYASVPISPISSPRGSGQPVWP